MKKIFHFVTTNVLSGLENVVINISLLLSNQNKYEFYYVSPSGVIDDYLNKYNIKHIVVNKITPFTVRRIIRNYNPDIVHGHDVKASLSLAFNSYLCHKNNIKIISELHNDDPRMQKISLRSFFYSISSHFYDNIIVISNPVLDNYIFKRHIISKTTIIDNIVNPLRIKYHKKYSNNKIWDCIFLGRFVKQKDPLKFVKIINLLKKMNNNISAIMLGEGPLFAKTKYLINYYQLSDNIKLLGFKENPYKYLYGSKLLILPSKYEGFGLVALESLLCNTPVISTYTGGLKNIITNKCGNFASSTKEFSDKISTLLKDEKLYDLKRNNTNKRAKRINNVYNFIKKYMIIYDN